MDSAGAVGFYGKLPCKGDFLQRRVPQEFVDVWDPWLQTCLHVSRQTFEERWLDTYLTSPVWRFVLAEGVCGSGAYAGVTFPSVDRVGRYFPLTIVAQLAVEDCPLDVACAEQGWFERVEALGLAALDAPDLDLGEFEAQIAQLGSALVRNEASETAYLRDLVRATDFPYRPEGWHVPLAGARSLSKAVNNLAFRELERALRPVTLWWSDGSEAQAACWLCTRGLPTPDGFLGMLSGGWQQSGWTSLDPRPQPAPGTRQSRVEREASPVPADPQLRARAEPLDITVAHEPRRAEAGEDDSIAHFIERPEIGLCAVATCRAGASAAAREEAVFAISDALHGLEAAASLSALAEQARRKLLEMREHIGRSDLKTRALVLLMHDDECALLGYGGAQALCSRPTEPMSVFEFGTREGPDAEQALERAERAPPAGMSLLDLVAAPSRRSEAAGADDVVVLYERLRADDLWLIAGDALFEGPSLAALDQALAGGRASDEEALAAARVESGTTSNRALPVLVVRVARMLEPA